MLVMFITALAVLALSACQGANGPTETAATQPAGAQTAPAERGELTVMTHDSFAVSEGLVEQFEAEYNVDVSFFQAGDTGSALNRAILSKENPLADVLYGVDNTFLSRALEEDIFEPYDSPAAANIPDEFRLTDDGAVQPVDYGDVCINYDKTYFAENDLPLPATLEDLTDPAYAGLLVAENPATSSPGLAFMLATIVHFGEDGWLDYWQQLVENEVVVVNDWSTAYYTNFSGSTGQGPQPLVVSYASSPVAEVYFADPQPEQAPTGSITGDDMCFRQIEFVGILRGTQQRELAEAWVDFMLSVPFQEELPLQMFVFPVNPEAQLPQVYQDFAEVPANPARMDAQTISDNREGWIQTWTDSVLR
jgi:thiamine transport system substrate-binding protein